MSIYQNIYFSGMFFSSIATIGRNFLRFVYGGNPSNQIDNGTTNNPINSTKSENPVVIEEENPIVIEEENPIVIEEENPVETNGENQNPDTSYNGVIFLDCNDVWQVVPGTIIPVRDNPTISAELIRYSNPNEIFYVNGISFYESINNPTEEIQWLRITQYDVPQFIKVLSVTGSKSIKPINTSTRSSDYMDTKNDEIIHKAKKSHFLKSLLGNGKKYIHKKLYGSTYQKKVNNFGEPPVESSSQHVRAPDTQIDTESNSTPKSNDMECCICYNAINEKIILIPCGHIRFCIPCIDKLPNKKCPLCAQDFEQYYRIFD